MLPNTGHYQKSYPSPFYGSEAMIGYIMCLKTQHKAEPRLNPSSHVNPSCAASSCCPWSAAGSARPFLSGTPLLFACAGPLVPEPEMSLIWAFPREDEVGVKDQDRALQPLSDPGGFSWPAVKEIGGMLAQLQSLGTISRSFSFSQFSTYLTASHFLLEVW